MKKQPHALQNNQNIGEISDRLLAWYDVHGRDLPWRVEAKPYKVWVSEIMSQQTRIAAMLPYYEKWINRFPNVQALAEAQEDEVLKSWEGLGYYSRARNLQKAARVIMDEYHGSMPSSSAELRKLPGVGPYTAAAVASIAFGERVAAVDGNALRVIARLFGISLAIDSRAGKETVETLLYAILPSERPGDGNQAIMDLGSYCCIPKQPRCEECPIETLCVARGSGWERVLPIKSPKKAQRVEYRAVALLTDEAGKYLLRRRKERLLHGLWEFPGETLESADTLPRWHMLEELGLQPEGIEGSLRADHLFTHIHWKMQGFWMCAVSVSLPPEYAWVEAQQLSNYAIPSAMSAFLKAVLAKERVMTCKEQVSLL